MYSSSLRNAKKMVHFIEDSYTNKLEVKDQNKQLLQNLQERMQSDQVSANNLLGSKLSNFKKSAQFLQKAGFIFKGESSEFDRNYHANKDFRTMYRDIKEIQNDKNDNINQNSSSENSRRYNNLVINPNLNLPYPSSLLNNNSVNVTKSNYAKYITDFVAEMAKFKHQVYNYNYKNNKLVSNLYTLLEYAFRSMNSLISKPVLSITPEKIIIHLFFFVINDFPIKRNLENANRNASLDVRYVFRPKANFIKKNLTKLESLCALLSHYLKKPVELDLVKLYYPFLEPNILALTIASMANDVKLRFIFKNIFKYTVIKNSNSMVQRKRFSFLPCALTGLNIKVAGRLKTQRVVPRKTIKLLEKGSLSRTNAVLVQNARFTNKNKRGSFSISVSLGYKI